MKTEEKWPLVHAYRNAVENESVPAILCPDDSYPLVTVRDTDGGPAFKCFECQSILHIGQHVYDQMKRNLNE